MENKIYVHDFKKRIESAKIQIKNLKEVDKEAINKSIEFIEDLELKDFTAPRVAYYATKLPIILRLAGKLSIEKEYMRKFLLDLKNYSEEYSKTMGKNNLNENSKKEYTKVYRKLLAYSFNVDLKEDTEKLKILKTSKCKYSKPQSEDMLTLEEIDLMIKNTNNPLYKAYFSALFESGCRVGEIHTIRYKDVKFDRYGVLINIRNSKTEQRELRLFLATKYLSAWQELHPTKDPEDFFWYKLNSKTTYYNDQTPRDLNNKLISYASIRKMIEVIARRSNIKKPINHQNWRRSSATYFAPLLKEQVLKKKFGWSVNSSVASRYISISDNEANNSLLRIYGIEPEEKESINKAKICNRCLILNLEKSRFCYNCGFTLEEKEAKDIETLQKDVLLSGASLDRYMEKNKDMKFPEIIEELVKKKVEEILALKLEVAK